MLARSDWLLKQRIASAIYVQTTREARVNYEKMVYQVATVTIEQILQTNEDAIPANTKKATKYGLGVLAEMTEINELKIILSLLYDLTVLE